MVSNNAINTVSQPGFFAYLTTTTGQVTGAGAVYQIGSGGSTFTIPFQNGSAFSSACIFTAPANGLYFFNMVVVYDGLTSAMNDLDLVFIHSVGGNLYGVNQNPGTAKNGSNGLVLNASLSYPMNRNETMQFRTAIVGGAGNTATIRGFNTNTSIATSIRGFLVYYL